MGDAKRQKTEIEIGEKRQKAEIDIGEKVEKRQKTEIEMVEKVETVEKEESGSVSFEELRDDLLREAAELVAGAFPTKIAIWFTHPSESDVQMYTFGFPAGNVVVETFLEDIRTVLVPVDKDAEDEDVDENEDEVEDADGSSKVYWWEDSKRLESLSPEELDAEEDRTVRLLEYLTRELDLISSAEGSEKQQGVHNDNAQAKP